MLLLRCDIGLNRVGKKALQSASFDAGLTELPRGARSRCEALDFVALHLDSTTCRGQGRSFTCTCKSLDTLNTVGGAEDIVDHALLCAIQMRVAISDLDRICAGHRRLEDILTFAHPAHDLPFRFDGP